MEFTRDVGRGRGGFILCSIDVLEMGLGDWVYRNKKEEKVCGPQVNMFLIMHCKILHLFIKKLTNYVTCHIF